MRYFNLKKIILLLALMAFSLSLFAMTFPLPSSNNDLVGETQTITVEPGQTIYDITQKYDMGYLELKEANPNLDLENLWPGQKMVIPSAHILPNAPRQGIVINLSELRLYYYPPHEAIVMTYPVGIGREGEETPVMTTTIGEKKMDPEWRPTDETRRLAAEKGVILPSVIHAGPQNPLGNYAMRLGGMTYLIHGTNDPTGIGLRVTGGCIRLFPKDIEELFKAVSVGTKVTIVTEPNKAGWLNDTFYLESHKRMDKNLKTPDSDHRSLSQVIMQKNPHDEAEINWDTALAVAKQKWGVPEPIGEKVSS